MPHIDFVRDEVKNQLPRWKLIRDCLAGQDRIKEKGVEYLPMPNAHDKSTENKERYAAYKLRAMFLNAVDNTLQGLIGQVFAADPVVELPASMELLLEDCDGEGVTLTQRAKKVLGEVVALGRSCLLVDFPKAPLSTEVDNNGNARERDFTRAELMEGVARANILQFDPEKVINWRTRLVGGKRVYSLVVIAMQYVVYDDGFEVKYDDEWRVLKLDDADEYVCEVWRKSTDATQQSSGNAGGAQFVMHDSYKPRDANGAPLREIPFTFVGSLNNNESPDKPPMYDIAVVNIAHYRNSADYEECVYMLGQFTPTATGLTSQWIKDVWKDKEVQFGSRAVIPLPVNGKLELVGAPENGMVIEAMRQKEQQMAMLGARLVEKQEVQRTLGEAQMERAQVESVLVQCAKNTAAALLKCLKWAALFYGESTEGMDYQLSTDFAISKMTPEERKALIAEYQGGLVSWEEARYALRQCGLAYEDDAKARAQIDQEAQTRIDMAAAEAEALAAASSGGEGEE